MLCLRVKQHQEGGEEHGGALAVAEEPLGGGPEHLQHPLGERPAAPVGPVRRQRQPSEHVTGLVLAPQQVLQYIIII